MSSDEETTAEVLRTPTEWATLKSIVFVDYDGWRKGADTKSFSEPISEAEFKSRLAITGVLYT